MVMELFGVIGSPIDVATFLGGLVFYLVEYRPGKRLRSAAIVALAKVSPGVDDELLASELEVEERDVAKVEHTIVACGGREDA